MSETRSDAAADREGYRDHLLTVRELARRLSVSERTAWKVLQEGHLPRVRIGHATRVRASDVQRLIADGPQAQADEHAS